MKTYPPTRRDAIRTGAAAALGAVSVPIPALGQQDPVSEPRRPASLDLDLVGKFVGVCHRDLDSVKIMLSEEPGLVNASFNRGGSDWENGMEAAAHMGRPDIADVLIEHKARKSIFWAAMVGEEEIVKAYVLADFETVHTGGAHNISLLAHAAICGKVSLTQFLKDHGARLDKKSLEHAVRGNRVAMVQWLVGHGVDPAAKDIFGKPLHDAAAEKGFSEISAFLRSRAGI